MNTAIIDGRNGPGFKRPPKLGMCGTGQSLGKDAWRVADLRSNVSHLSLAIIWLRRRNQLDTGFKRNIEGVL